VTEIEWMQRELRPRIQAARQRTAAASDAGARIVVLRDGRHVLASLRWLNPMTDRPTAFGHVVRFETLAGEVLGGVVSDLELDSSLRVQLVDHATAAGSSGQSVVEPLAVAPLISDAPGWQVALFDTGGRSVAQIVGRERWTYGALVGGMLAVMAVGLVLIARTSRRAAELSRAKTEFVANVTHELKTPLALIRMFGETLESGLVPDDEQRREFAGVMRRESERLTHLINNVLDLGRIDAGTKRYELVPGDLVEIVRQALEAYRPLFDRLGFEIAATLPSRPIDVTMDRDAVVQSLVNLFQNVIKYAGEGGYVGVSVAGDDAWARVSVTDRGVGMPADEIPHIFEPYYRSPALRGPAPAGSGLGLSIVQHAIAAHGGRVEVASTPGAGSTFTLILPITHSGIPIANGEATVARAGA
jgi:signal transduction histidine kinase